MKYVYRGLRKKHSAKRWTSEEDTLAKTLLESGMTCREVGAALGRSKQAVVMRNTHVLKVPIRKSKKWTDDEEEKAKRLLMEGRSYSEVGQALDRTARSIIHKNFRKWHIINVQPRKRNGKVTRRSRYSRRHHDDTRFDGNRVSCLIRDDFKCQDCGIQDYGDTILNVHHIDGNGKGSPDPNNRLSNLITLCVHCHTKLHRREEKAYA